MKGLNLFFVVFLIAISTIAQTAPVNDAGLAIGGYDVVAYFDGSPQKGTASYKATHDGVTYHFSSKANQQKFQKSPDAYIPQFGGFCAYAIAAKGGKFPINPETFDIVDGKLYLFYNGPVEGGTFNTYVPWDKDRDNLVVAGHKKWADMGK